MRINMVLTVAVVCALKGQSQPKKPSQVEVVNCRQVTNTHPGLGRVFRGTVTNEDYNFTAHIPPRLTGWDVAEPAPFHGSTIFLDSNEKSCIHFEIHIRIDESLAPERSSMAKHVQLGEAQGWQYTARGVVDDINLTNVTTVFSFKHSHETDDGEILLVAPTSRIGDGVRTYESFLHSLTFGPQERRSK